MPAKPPPPAEAYPNEQVSAHLEWGDCLIEEETSARDSDIALDTDAQFRTQLGQLTLCANQNAFRLWALLPSGSMSVRINERFHGPLELVESVTAFAGRVAPIPFYIWSRERVCGPRMYGYALQIPAVDVATPMPDLRAVLKRRYHLESDGDITATASNMGLRAKAIDLLSSSPDSPLSPADSHFIRRQIDRSIAETKLEDDDLKLLRLAITQTRFDEPVSTLKIGDREAFFGDLTPDIIARIEHYVPSVERSPTFFGLLGWMVSFAPLKDLQANHERLSAIMRDPKRAEVVQSLISRAPEFDPYAEQTLIAMAAGNENNQIVTAALHTLCKITHPGDDDAKAAFKTYVADMSKGRYYTPAVEGLIRAGGRHEAEEIATRSPSHDANTIWGVLRQATDNDPPGAC